MLLLLALAGCADPGKDKSVAAVTPPAPPATAPAIAPAPAASIEGAVVVPVTGTIGFTGAKITKSHDGSFSGWTGEAALKDNAIVRVKFAVRVDTVDVGIAKLNDHLKSPDFFDAAQFPEATFTSTAITPGAPPDSKLSGATHTVAGDLTLRGVTKSVRFPAVLGTAPAGATGKTEFVINRKDFKIEYPGKPDDLIADDVVIRVDFAAAAPTGGSPHPATHP